MPWRNGRGVTWEIAVCGDASEWDWRLSLATVDVDGPFSVFAGVDRQILVVDGAGMTLIVGDVAVACAPFHVVRFDGEATTSARLIDGPVRDLNLMTRRGASTATLSVVNASTAIVDVANADVIVALDALSVETSIELVAFDALLDPGPVRFGGGRAAIIVVNPLDQEQHR